MLEGEVAGGQICGPEPAVAAGEPAVDETVVPQEETVVERCVVGRVGHGKRRLDRQHLRPCTRADGGVGNVGDFGAGVDAGVGVESVVGKLHQNVGQRALQLASGRLAEVLQAWRGVAGEQAHVFEPAEPGVHEPVGVVGVGVAQSV
jgi:hypothetical protein